MPDFVNSLQVAQLLGLSIHTFRAKRRQLATLGFPPPLPWNSRLWRRGPVEAFALAGGLLPPEGGKVAIHPAAKAAAARRIAERAGA